MPNHESTECTSGRMHVSADWKCNGLENESRFLSEEEISGIYCLSGHCAWMTKEQSRGRCFMFFSLSECVSVYVSVCVCGWFECVC